MYGNVRERCLVSKFPPRNRHKINVKPASEIGETIEKMAGRRLNRGFAFTYRELNAMLSARQFGELRLTCRFQTGRYKVLKAPSQWRNGNISREDIAHFLVRQIEDRAYVRETPVLVY